MGLDLSIIVVSYNTRELTLACLRSVFEQTRDVSFEVIVVDNASADGSAEAIAAAFPRATLLAEGKNHGFAGANNIGAARASGEYILLLNPDTVVLEGAVQKLVAFARSHPGAGIWGGRTVFEDGRLNPTCCWAFPTVWSMFCRGTGLAALFRGSALFAPESFGNWARDSVRQVDIVSGCFFLIRRELWERLGGFDPAFFMYAEEVDLCIRAGKLGARPMFTPEATIVHYGGKSDRVREDQTIRQYRAKVQLFRKHWSRPAAWFGTRMLDLWALSKLARARVLRLAGRTGKDPLETWQAIWSRRGEWRAARA